MIDGVHRQNVPPNQYQIKLELSELGSDVAVESPADRGQERAEQAGIGWITVRLAGSSNDLRRWRRAVLTRRRHSQVGCVGLWLRNSIVGLWYGGDSPFEGEPEHRAALKSLMDLSVVVFPVCGDITLFPQQIPKELQPIGGTQGDEARITGNVLSVYRARRALAGSAPPPAATILIRAPFLCPKSWLSSKRRVSVVGIRSAVRLRP